MSSNRPAAKFTIGFVTANVWENDGPKKSFYTVEVVRTFKDNDALKNTFSFGHADIFNVIEVLRRAEAFIASKGAMAPAQ